MCLTLLLGTVASRVDRVEPGELKPRFGRMTAPGNRPGCPHLTVVQTLPQLFAHSAVGHLNNTNGEHDCPFPGEAAVVGSPVL